MDPSSHKRTRSQMAKNLVRRGSSNTNVRDEAGGDLQRTTSHAGSDASSFNSATNTMNSSSSASRAFPSNTPRSKHRPHLSATMSNASFARGGNGEPNTERAAPEDRGPSSPTASSLEASVKLFRLFEALRSGDTSAISRAMRDQREGGSEGKIEGTTILHMAIQCAEQPVIEFVISNLSAPADSSQGINARDKDGNTPLIVAARLNRAPIVRLLLQQKDINDGATNYNGQSALDLAHSPDISQQLALARSMYIEANLRAIHEAVATNNYEILEQMLADQRLRSTLDIDSEELATDPLITASGGALLHQAARKQDHRLIQLLLLNGADPFRRDRKGKLPQDFTKDERTRAILKKSPAAAAAQRGIQERAILGGAAPQTGSASNDHALGNKEGREMKGYLKKWTNYTAGWKLRFFVLEDGVLSYYKHQDDAGTACRGAINMKIASLSMDPQDKLKFDIVGKSSVRYNLKANHQVECKRWFWALNNAIQWAKDEAKDEVKRLKEESDHLRHIKEAQSSHQEILSETQGSMSIRHRSKASITHDEARAPSIAASTPVIGAGDSAVFESSTVASDQPRAAVQDNGPGPAIEGDPEDDENYGEDASSHDLQPINRDAFAITAQSVRLQLDLLAQVSTSLQTERDRGSTMSISDPVMIRALSTYDSATGNLRGLVGDLFRISKDRDAYWQHRLEREANMRRMWEDSMAKFAHEHEELQKEVGESEDKRKKTKKALKDALETLEIAQGGPATPLAEPPFGSKEPEGPVSETTTLVDERAPSVGSKRRKTMLDLSELSDSGSEDDGEFFDAVGEGEVEVIEALPEYTPNDSMAVTTGLEKQKSISQEREYQIKSSFLGYEDPIRTRLRMDADNRPKVSLWSILKSMIGKDMTKMTLPVTFNEPTSLLQRVAEDMEYTDLLDTAASRLESTERMVYVAAFAASEYASTIGRVAKPFNPLLGETYEYARPDKGFRFFIEQVSHHPPIGAAWAESARWSYFGESAVKSKFYGKSFDINPLGTWFLRLRPASGEEELYTWKKVTSSVINIITGNPTVDNIGTMEVRNHTTGETCVLEFKPRGWKASSAYQVVGKITDKSGQTRWSIGGRWNDKIYARLTPGWEDSALQPTHPSHANLSKKSEISSTQAFLVWEANPRPTGIPFNLTPFGVTLNALTDNLQSHLAPTDTRFRPDQRAMEDGEYDLAATEKNRVEEKQRAMRRLRETKGEEFVPRWFEKARCDITGEEYWKFNDAYWKTRKEVAERRTTWQEQGLEDIF